ncbi:MAG: hypothetical protein QM790_11745 [Nibricoccus sp.]
MNDREVRHLDAIDKIGVFGRDNKKDFAEQSEAAKWFAELDVTAGVIRSAATGQAAGRATARSVLLDTLRLDLKGIARTAREIDEEQPGFADNFRLSSNTSQTALLTTASRMLQELQKEGVAAQFFPYEMAPTFVEDLAEDLETIGSTKDDESSKDTSAVANTAKLSQAIARGVRLVGKLNAAMNNKYKHDPVKLAAWNTASHVERTPRRQKSSTDGTTPTNSEEPKKTRSLRSILVMG